MSKLNFYKYSAISLLLLNIALVAFLLFSPPKGRPLGGKNQRATQVMNLDEAQNEAFLMSAKVHQSKIEELNNQQRAILKTHFETLLDDEKVAQNDSLLIKASVIEQEKVAITYQHFAEIKELLKPEQQAGFKEFVDLMLQRILRIEKKPTPPRKLSYKKTETETE